MAEKQRDAKTTMMNDGNKPSVVNPTAVLRELFELLEDYGPAWYTQETHERAFAALVQGPR
jgi:hypothetical protein